MKMTNEITLCGIRDDGIRIVIEQIHTEPGLKFTGYEDCRGRITIRSGPFCAEDARLWTSVNSLRRFCRELEECYRTLSGTAGHETYENNLALTVTMTPGGHALVRGVFKPDMTDDNVLKFTYETDQTCISETIRGLRHFLNFTDENLI